MCQLSAYLVRTGEEELVLEDVAMVQVKAGKVFLTTLFQQREAIDARIQVVDLVRNKLLLQPNDSEETKAMTETTEQQKLAMRLDHWIEHNTAPEDLTMSDPLGSCFPACPERPAGRK